MNDISPIKMRRLSSSVLDNLVSPLPSSPLGMSVARTPIYSPVKRYECSNGTSIKIETHQGKHCINGWPGYSGRKGSCFNQSYTVTPLNLGILKQAWETFSRESVATNEGYWRVDCRKEIGTENETVLTIQWAFDESDGSFWIHGYPSRDESVNASIRV